MNIPQSIRELIDKGPLAHLTTLNRDGHPQVTLIWLPIENDEFVIGHLALHQKIKNIRRDPRVALSRMAPRRIATGNPRIPGGLRQRARRRRRRRSPSATPRPTLLRPKSQLPSAKSIQRIFRLHHENRARPILSGIGPWAEKSAESAIVGLTGPDTPTRLYRRCPLMRCTKGNILIDRLSRLPTVRYPQSNRPTHNGVIYGYKVWTACYYAQYAVGPIISAFPSSHCCISDVSLQTCNCPQQLVITSCTRRK